MNKYKEALDTIVDLYEYLYINKLHESGNHIDDLKEYWTLNELVEKSIPKKPYFESDGYADGYPVYDTWICPNCGENYETEFDKYDYCPHCGQRIDWDLEEE